ncbi:MAG: short chain dehydrogenase [Methanobacterium sp. PtaB.Bin024]|nr:SDR family oxidoreductase [Methanobacteriaceae archaeon]OPX60641.1 MAG: short chain dehydrogenase [Methanobacterium sp. PtaB.Bin024]OPY23788.1 MAG: short chain dehydrogenase [Methanobacterium sp. PtaU1.Bin097]
MVESKYYKDKICIVTGANSGIGYALTEELLKRGSIVYMAGRNPEKVQKASIHLSDYEDRIHTVIVDVTKQDQVQKAIEDTAEESGRIDFLFNNAGVGFGFPFTAATLEDWKTIIDTNLWSVIYGVHAAVPIMLKQGSGHIVNTGSFAGIFPTPFESPYVLTKFGVTGLTESLRYEYRDNGLYFSTICPANVATPIFNKGLDGKPIGDLKIPDNAYPADKAAVDILNAVAEHKGIIVIPKEPYENLWKCYVLNRPEAESFVRQMSEYKRAAFKEIFQKMDNQDREKYEELIKIL